MVWLFWVGGFSVVRVPIVTTSQKKCKVHDCPVGDGANHHALVFTVDERVGVGGGTASARWFWFGWIFSSFSCPSTFHFHKSLLLEKRSAQLIR